MDVLLSHHDPDSLCSYDDLQPEVFQSDVSLVGYSRGERDHMRRIAGACLVGCLSLPLYFGLKRTPYAFGFESYDSYMTKHYGFEGWTMHQYIYSHVQKGSSIHYVGASMPPQFYWQDYLVWWGESSISYDYVLLVKQNMQQQPDGNWKNTYLPALNLTFPGLTDKHLTKVWETDRSILFKRLAAG